jgi:glycosyltransferase involved in cell wall biosynthesis
MSVTDRKKLPTISIGMPVFNGQQSIRKALDSLIVQTYSDFELIISDNASTDETQAICREYAAKDYRIRYVLQEKNNGVFANFDYILRSAVGKYFMWAAHDDWWGEDFIQSNLNILESCDNVVLSFCDVECEDERGIGFRTILYSGNCSLSGMTGFALVNEILSQKKYNIYIYGLFKRDVLLAYFHNVDYIDRWLILAIALNRNFVGHAEGVHYHRKIYDAPIEKRHSFASDRRFLRSVPIMRQWLYLVVDRTVVARAVKIEIVAFLAFIYVLKVIIKKWIFRRLLNIHARLKSLAKK